MRHFTGLLGLFLFFSNRYIDALDCYTCSNATNISGCRSTKACGAGEVCFSDHILTTDGMLYSYGCKPETNCQVVRINGNTGGSGSLVGRSGITGSCSECCKENRCNRQLCLHSYSEKECTDSTEIHCPTVGVMIDMCSDTDKANVVCRRFCGLCNYVNGQWSAWFAWSKCDVTCGTGTKTRHRNCSEPQPSGGGHFCVGQELDTDTCTLELCPLHGSWAAWTPWGSCSASCGVGLRRRDRSCSNPYPARFGDHCFGDGRDDQICLSNACADGGWADWTAWGTCSRTCGDGIKTRSRTCDNPLPSIQGRYCQGDPYQVVTCNLKACSEIHGSWGLWSDWSHCSDTCDNGMRSRLRDCDSPVPSAGGKYCSGSPFDVQRCIIKPCPRKLSAFTVKTPIAGHCLFYIYTTYNCTLNFKSVTLNEGQRYLDGTFTCLYPGLYYFEAYLVAKDRSGNELNCYMQKNNHPIVQLQQRNPIGTYNGTLSTTGSTTLYLVKGDFVNIFCSLVNSLHTSSTFNGFLIIPDP